MVKFGRLLDAQEQRDLTSLIPGLRSSLDTLNHNIENNKASHAELQRLLTVPPWRSVSQPNALISNLDTNKRTEILQWLSLIPYHHHHQAFLKDIIPGSGQWFLSRQEYLAWISSSSSEIFWLQGFSGSGKTRLATIVIESLMIRQRDTQNPAPLAYFYCSRDQAEPERAKSRHILQTLVKQLSQNSSNGNLFRPTWNAFDRKVTEAARYGLKPSALEAEECASLLHELAVASPLTMIIDAVDECHPAERRTIFKIFQDLVATSANVVKIFLTSREEDDIAIALDQSLGLRITEDDNSTDIASFVQTRVHEAIRDRRLLPGIDPSKFQQKVIDTLLAKSQGM